MVKATGLVGGRRTLFLGLSSGNLRRLQEGDPIRFDTDYHGFSLTEGVEQVVILWGETEEHISEQLKLVSKGGFDG